MEKIKEQYPDGFEEYLITYTNPKGEIEVALPLETEDTSYLIKMPKDNIPEEEDDFDISTELAKSFDNIDTFEIDKEIESAILGKEFDEAFIDEDEEEEKVKSKSKKKSTKTKKSKKSEDFEDEDFDDFDEDYEDEYDEEDFEDEEYEEDDDDDNLLI